MTKTLEEIIIRAGNEGTIYRSNLSLTLWRAVLSDTLQNSSDGSKNPFYPDLEARKINKKDTRPPDIETYVDEKTGKLFVKAELKKGISFSDKSHFFKSKKWSYVTIPAGTTIPSELIFVRDGYHPRDQRSHYSLSPNKDMSVEDFLRALDQLVINVSQRMKELKYG